MIAFETTLEVGNNSGVKKTVISKEFILKTLEHLTTEYYEVKERLKHQDEKTLKIKGLLGEILSRLPPPHKP